MLLYIHGFGSSAHSFKAQALLKRCAERQIPAVCPNLPTVPQLAIQTLQDWVTLTRPNVIVGSSLGGFYARWLAHRYELPAVLINPALRPDLRLLQVAPMATQYFDGSSFEFNASHCQALETLIVEGDQQHRLWLLSQRGDEVLDANEAIRLLPNARHTIEPGGDHGFHGFERYLDEIIDWRAMHLP